MEEIVAKILGQVLIVEVLRDRQCLTLYVPNVVPTVRCLSGQMAERKFSAVSVLRLTVESPEAPVTLEIPDLQDRRAGSKEEIM